MTERLSTLLHDEASVLDVPSPDSTEVLASGHRMLRRRRLVAGAVALSVAAVAGVGVALVLDATDSSAPGTAIATSPGETPAYGVVLADGSQVAVGDGRAEVDGTVHDLVFTSEGALVRSNQNGGASDGSGPEALTLVRPDGSTVDLGTIPEGVGPATDASEPLYALAEKDGDGFAAVLREVTTGDEVGRVALPDKPPSYWDVPPLALEGDHVYVGFKNETWVVDWHTGDARQVSGKQGGIPEISGGRMVVGYGESLTVTDVASGEELMTQQLEGYGYGQLSPDGENLVVTIEEGAPPDYASTATLYSVDTGESLELPTPDSGGNWSWTPQGDALKVSPDGITVCDVTDGCSPQPLPSGFGGEVTPGGQRFES